MSATSRPGDDRAGLPSGSGAKRWLACPGSFMAEQCQPESQSDDAAEGEMLHAVLESGDAPHRAKLTEEQTRCIEFCRATRARLSAELLGSEEVPAYVEERWWLRHPDTLDPLASCRIDWAGWRADAMLIIDWKFGRAAVDPADVNDQLRFAASVAWMEYALKTVYVAIVAPRAEGERVTVAKFTATDCATAHAEMVAGAIRTVQAGQPRHPSAAACRYCRARGTASCPESIAVVAEQLATVQPSEIATPARLAELLDRCELAERVIDAVRAGAKERIAAGEQIPGWRLKPGATAKKITDAKAAWAKVGVQIGGATFADCCTVSLPDLAKAWKAQAADKKTEKEARAEVEALLAEAGAITESQRAPSLAREVAA